MYFLFREAPPPRIFRNFVFFWSIFYTIVALLPYFSSFGTPLLSFKRLCFFSISWYNNWRGNNCQLRSYVSIPTRDIYLRSVFLSLISYVAFPLVVRNCEIKISSWFIPVMTSSAIRYIVHLIIMLLLLNMIYLINNDVHLLYLINEFRIVNLNMLGLHERYSQWWATKIISCYKIRNRCLKMIFDMN
jgi:hypothetical protein